MRTRLATLALGALVAGVLGALAPASADPPAPGPPRLTLAECVARAERAYPGVAAQRHKIAAARAQLSEAWAAPFLNFSATGAFTIAPYARGNPTFSPDAFAQNPFDTGYEPFARASVETGVPVSPWTWWRLGHVRDAARAGVRASEHEAAKVRLELRTNVRRAFFGLQLARDNLYLLDRALGYLDTAEGQLASLERSDAGTSLQSDRRQLLANRFEASARRSQAAAGERTARFTLGMLTGVGDGVDIVDEPLCPYQGSLHPLAHYLREARLRRPEVQMIEAGLAARRAAVAIQWGAYLPDLAVGLTAAWSSAPSITDQLNPFAGGNQNFAYWGAALVMRWNFEPLANWFRVARVREELAMTEAQQRLALGGIGVEVAEIYNRALSAQEQERDWGGSERVWYEEFTAKFQEYQGGGGDAAAIITPLTRYLQARASHLQAVHDLNVALAQLAQATGREEMYGAPDPACARPAEVGAPGEDAGVSDEEINELLGATADDADAGPAHARDAVATDVATPREGVRGNRPRNAP